MFRQNLTLHFNPEPSTSTAMGGAPSLQLDMSRGLHLNLSGACTTSVADTIDVDVPLARQR